jgi:hypothetical protein
MLSCLSDRSRTRDMISLPIMSGVRLLSESHDSMWPTCWYYHVSCTTSVGKSRQHVTNMLHVGHMLSWLSDRSRTPNMITLPCWSHAVVTFRQKSYTRDQHVNVIMCRVRLLSESDGSMWTTCWYYHVSCNTSVGKSRQHVTNMLMPWLSDRSRAPHMITLTCWSHAVMTFQLKSHTTHDNINMFVTCCRDFPTEVVHGRKVTAACDQHVDIIMSRVRLLSESHDSMWPTC